MTWVAVAIGGSAVLGAGVSSSSSKKTSGSGSEILEKIASQLFDETGNLRATTIGQAEQALTTGNVDDPTLARTRSSISAEGSTLKSSKVGELERAGLRNSSVGIASLEDIDRATAQLLVDADTKELNTLTQLGRGLGFGVVADSTKAASALSASQSSDKTRSSTSATSTGSALGEAISLLLTRNSRTATTTGGSGFTGVNDGSLSELG